MSVITPAGQQGPAPTNTQTRIHNNTLKIASTGGQNAVYHVVGGPITDNVNLSLPPLAGDDTVATLSANNNWTGTHNFANGFNASGPITASAINASGPITTTDAIVANGGVTSIGPLVAKGNFNAANLQTPGTLGVGGAATITGTINAATTTTTGPLTSGAHTVTGTHTVSGQSTLNGLAVVNNQIQAQSHVITGAGGLNLNHSGSNIIHIGTYTALNPTNSHFVAGGFGHLNLSNNFGGSNDTEFFGVATGATKGCFIATAPAMKIGFYNGGSIFGHTPFAQYNPGLAGNISVDTTWTAHNQALLNAAMVTLASLGLFAN